MKYINILSLIKLVVLFQNHIYTGLSELLDHHQFMVSFEPFIKQTGNYGEGYTLENIKTMLIVISGNISNVLVTMDGVYPDEYTYNDTYYNGAPASVFTGEKAALINSETTGKTISVFLRLYEVESPAVFQTEVLLVLESVEKANTIYPKTVKGIVFQLGEAGRHAERNLRYVTELRDNATKLGVELGVEGFCDDHLNPSNQSKFEIERDLVLRSDFFICIVRPNATLSRMSALDCFNAIQNIYWRDIRDTGLGDLIDDYNIMMKTSWENTYVSQWEGMQKQKRYWEIASRYGNTYNFTVIIMHAFDHPGGPYSERQLGWWRLTDDSKINSVDGYIEKASATRPPEPPTPWFNDLMLVAFLVAGIVLIILLASFVLVIMRIYGFHNLLGPEANDFFYGGNNATQDFKLGYSVNGTANIYSYDSSYEISKENLVIDKDQLLGTGQFGQVFKGIIKNSDSDVVVAVKTLRRGAPKSAIKCLMSEIKIMSYLGRHSNIVALKGACTAESAIGVVYLATELCSLGSLGNYLRNGQLNSVTDDDNPCSEYVEALCNVVTKVTISDMLRWSHEIASGMEFLGQKNVVHADLATRNVLLTSSKTAKITDFGLSRRMYAYNNYVKKGQEPMPWRWMSPESLLRSEFSTHSDVWSYGITLWEIFTMGDTPYSGLSWTHDFAESLQCGVRLPSPPYASSDMYVYIINYVGNYFIRKSSI